MDDSMIGPWLLELPMDVTIYVNTSRLLEEFRDWAYKRTPLSTRQQAYTRPIAHESRAFARLDSIGENGTWAVNCHGWMKLSDKEFKRLQKYDSLTRWAVVKDYNPNTITISDVPEIRRKMIIARKVSFTLNM
ncbi:hypothetical protein D8B26_005421 [Coccidioides posadasii str. Silveira]|uniref:Predicted protein n=1 Tax=Coccidioides posadasii (strain RMSCC 757 / Silveira) TaxID=443226 RepID=E9DJV1_COCPS|nr:predicted protein [Coccidioides posadasii str. Silveira]QVM10768.1 hypothetical protein D8B26_005421 [Coccidioides posadasii str. Silveira]